MSIYILGTSGIKFGGDYSLLDTNGNELLKTEGIASAVNEITTKNAATGGAPSLAATGDDANISLDIAGKGAGVVQVKSAVLDKQTQTALTNTAAVTAAQLLTKILDGIPTAAATYTLPTAALLVAAIPGCAVGSSFYFIVNNKSADQTITVAAGAGGAADGTLTVAADVIRGFFVIITNVTGAAEAYFVYGLGA